MKKGMTRIALLAMAMGAALALAEVSDVISNVVGVHRLDLAPGRNAIGFNFRNTGATAAVDVQALFDTSALRGGLTPPEADRLLLWNADAQHYVELWLFDSGGVNPELDGKWRHRETGAVAAHDFSVGHGCWVINTTSEPVAIVLHGSVETAGAFTHAVLAGNNLLASAYPVDMALAEMDVSTLAGGTSRATSDRLILWDAVNQRYIEFWLFDSNGSHPEFDGKWIDRETGGVAGIDRVVPAGSAVWLLKRTSDAWLEERPF